MSASTSDPLPNPQRGQVWRVEFDPSRGAEIRKIRPAVVMSIREVGRLPLRVIVPLTGWQPTFTNAPWLVRIEPDTSTGLDKTSAADAFQIHSFAFERFVEQIGELTPEQMQEIAGVIAKVVGAVPLVAESAT